MDPDKAGLIGLVFALAPGYIADLLFRATWGISKGDNMDRVLRMAVWTAFGIALYTLFIGGPPNYLPIIIPDDIAGRIGYRSFEFNRATFPALAIHTVLACFASTTIGAMLKAEWAVKRFQRAFRRPFGDDEPWDVVFRQHREGRQILVAVKGGHTFAGTFLISGDGADHPRDLVLSDPFRLLRSGEWEQITDTRILYIPEAQIERIQLSRRTGEIPSEDLTTT